MPGISDLISDDAVKSAAYDAELLKPDILAAAALLVPDLYERIGEFAYRIEAAVRRELSPTLLQAADAVRYETLNS